MSVMGIDIGTSGCKAVVFADTGTQIANAYREYETLTPQQGWAELDSGLVMDSCMAVIAEAAAACADSDRVRAVGVSSQGEAFTAVGADGEYLSRGMVSFDTRAAGIAERWSRGFGAKRLYRATGHTPHPMFTLFKLLWVKEKQPEVWKHARAFYCFEDLLHHRLGLEPAISYPLAGRTMLFNVQTHRWDDEILDAVGLDPERLARPVRSGEVVGAIPVKTATHLGLEPGVIVVAGGHDQPCGALGAGVLASGSAVYGMGTAECITPAFEHPVFSDALFRSNLCTYDFTAENMYTTVAFSLTGGNLLRWYRDEWAAAEAAEAARRGTDVYEAILASLPKAPTELLVLPHFTPTGTPHFDTESTGAILGLRLTTTRHEVLKALLEGVTFEMKLNVDILNNSGIVIEQFLATGGGARSRALTQLKADVLGRPITTVAVTEAGCLGVAMLALQALSGENLKAIVERCVRPDVVLEPNPENAEIYAARFQQYHKLYPALRNLRRGRQM